MNRLFGSKLNQFKVVFTLVTMDCLHCMVTFFELVGWYTICRGRKPLTGFWLPPFPLVYWELQSCTSSSMFQQ